MTPDLRVPVPLDARSAIVEHIRTAWKDFPQQTIDGIRIDIPGGWALVRSSVTEPALTFRFEGLDWHALEDIVRRFCSSLPECGEALWNCYQAAMGAVEPTGKP